VGGSCCYLAEVGGRFAVVCPVDKPVEEFGIANVPVGTDRSV
jgi:hypothetical protein